MMSKKVILFLCFLHSAFADIRILSTDPVYNGTIIKEGDSTTLTCRTDKKWFFCLWTSPGGSRQCAIQTYGSDINSRRKALAYKQGQLPTLTIKTEKKCISPKDGRIYKENTPKQVCKGDPRITVSGQNTTCSLRISDVNVEDWGTWTCVVHDDIDFSSVRHHMSIYVGREGEISMTSPSLTAQADPDAPPTISLTEGEETTVHCNVKAAFPTPIFTWEGVAAAGGGGEEGWFDEGQIRVRKYAKTYADNGRGLSGNITVVQQGQHAYLEEGKIVNSVSSIVYRANINDTNSTIRCTVRQEDETGKILYSYSDFIRIHVNAMPPPLPVISYAEKVGIVSGSILACLFLLLLCVLLTMFMCRRENHRKGAGRTSPDSDDHYQVRSVWSTRNSKKTAPVIEFGGSPDSYGFSIGARYASRGAGAGNYATPEAMLYHQKHQNTSSSADGSMFEGSDDSAADLSGGKLSQRTAKLSGESGVTMLPPHAITSHVYPDFNNQTSSKRSSASYETERSLAEIESGSITFHQPPSVISSHDGTLNIGGGGMKNAPSLHETHFSVEGSDSPLTILHPPGLMFSRPSTVEPFHVDQNRKISASRSEGGYHRMQPYTLSTSYYSQNPAGAGNSSSRPASTLGVNLVPDWRQPQRLSTPTCPGSLMGGDRSTSSVFRCPHDCFLLDEEKCSLSSHSTNSSSGHHSHCSTINQSIDINQSQDSAGNASTKTTFSQQLMLATSTPANVTQTSADISQELHQVVNNIHQTFGANLME